MSFFLAYIFSYISPMWAISQYSTGGITMRLQNAAVVILWLASTPTKTTSKNSFNAAIQQLTLKHK